MTFHVKVLGSAAYECKRSVIKSHGPACTQQFYFLLKEGKILFFWSLLFFMAEEI